MMTQPMCFADVFKAANSERDNFLARVFAMFSEEPIRIWGRSDDAPYEYLGRPTLKRLGEPRGSTIDFALKSKADGRIFVAELKCEIAFARYGYLVLNSVDQVQRHVNDGKEAFKRFLETACDPHAYTVSVAGRAVEPAGAILVWGSITNEGKKAVIDHFGFFDVLSVESVINELLRTNNQDFQSFVTQRRIWCDELFAAMSVDN